MILIIVLSLFQHRHFLFKASKEQALMMMASWKQFKGKNYLLFYRGVLKGVRLPSGSDGGREGGTLHSGIVGLRMFFSIWACCSANGGSYYFKITPLLSINPFLYNSHLSLILLLLPNKFNYFIIIIIYYWL